MCTRNLEEDFLFLLFGGLSENLNFLSLLYISVSTMASAGQSRGQCGHLMAGFDTHSVCARCRDKKKGEDPCIKDKLCSHCELLTEDQKLRLATPAYQKKKEKRELKAKAEESSSTLVDPALVSVIGLAKDNGGKSSEEVSTTPVGVKAKKMDKNSGTVVNTPGSTKTKKIPDSKEPKEKSSKKRQSSPAKPCKVSTDSKLEAMDLRWSKRFSRLEAMLLAKSINQPEPSFQPVKITPVKPPPAGAVDNTEPFFAPTRATDRPNSSQPTSGPSLSVDRPSKKQNWSPNKSSIL